MLCFCITSSIRERLGESSAANTTYHRYLKPTTKHQPTAKHQQPPTNNQAQTTTNQAPTNSQAPATKHQTTNHQPTTNNQAPQPTQLRLARSFECSFAPFSRLPFVVVFLPSLRWLVRLLVCFVTRTHSHDGRRQGSCRHRARRRRLDVRGLDHSARGCRQGRAYAGATEGIVCASRSPLARRSLTIEAGVE